MKMATELHVNAVAGSSITLAKFSLQLLFFGFIAGTCVFKKRNTALSIRKGIAEFVLRKGADIVRWSVPTTPFDNPVRPAESPQTGGG